MPTSDVRCALVKIHGIGNQPEDWSRDFDALLDERLATLPAGQREQIVQHAVWWADLSRLPGLEAIGPEAVGTTERVTYELAYQQYMMYLAANEAAVSPSTEGMESRFGDFARGIFDRIRDIALTPADNANDVANYVSNNAVRLAVQRRLGDRLFEVRAAHPGATIIVGSHSQGTIIAYDVLRLLGPQLGQLVWVTMGSPLGWYLNFGRWGGDRLGIPEAMRWLNLYDRNDIVGRAVGGLVHWAAPRPEDIDVDNTGQGLGAHDHWHNRTVVEQYFTLIAEALGREGRGRGRAARRPRRTASR
jgi:hypothetical protein